MISDATILAVALPLLGGFATPLVEILGERIGSPKIRDYFALLISLITFGLILSMVEDVFVEGEVLVYHLAGRIPPWGINLAVDGFSLLAGLIASGLTLLILLYSIGFMRDKSGLGKYYVLILILCAGMLGVVFTGDIFNLYVFFEVMSISSYALVAFYQSGKSVEGAFKYLVMGTVGTVAILLGIAMVYGLTGTINIADLAVRLYGISSASSGFPLSMVIALGLFVTGFGIKIGMIPFHAWLPDAYEAAPASISSLFAGGTAVVGVYALLRVTYLLFGAIEVGTVFVALGFVSMIVGALMALVQSDLKRFLAYSGVSQMGYILLGVGIGTTLGIQGGLFHMLNNAIYKSLLFLCAGAVILRVGTSNMEKIGGLGEKMPVTTVVFSIGALSIAGIPPFNGFASKWAIYLAGINSGHTIYTVIAVVISALTLAYFLKALNSVFLGQTTKKCENVEEAPKSMLFPMLVLAVLCVVLGLFPELGREMVKPAQEALINHADYIQSVLGGI